MSEARASRRLKALSAHVATRETAAAGGSTGAAAGAMAPLQAAAYHALNPALDALEDLDTDSAKALAYCRAHPPGTRELQFAPVSTVEDAIREVRENGFAVWPHFVSQQRAARLAEDLEPLWEPTRSMPGVNGPKHRITGRNLSSPLLVKTRAADDVVADRRFLSIMDGLLQREGNAAITPRMLAMAGMRVAGSKPLACHVGHSSAKDVLDLERQQDLHQDDVTFPIPPSARQALGHPIYVNSLLALDPWTLENAATRFVPKSHTWHDRGPRFRGKRDDVDFVTIEADPGALMVFDGQVWHSRGPKLTLGTRRRALNVSCQCRWLRRADDVFATTAYRHGGMSEETYQALPDPMLKQVLG